MPDRPLFAAQHATYIELLRGLTDSDWERDTPCPGWTVKDIASVGSRCMGS